MAKMPPLTDYLTDNRKRTLPDRQCGGRLVHPQPLISAQCVPAVIPVRQDSTGVIPCRQQQSASGVLFKLVNYGTAEDMAADGLPHSRLEERIIVPNGKPRTCALSKGLKASSCLLSASRQRQHSRHFTTNFYYTGG